jgi:hypothetical protein
MKKPKQHQLVQQIPKKSVNTKTQNLFRAWALRCLTRCPRLASVRLLSSGQRRTGVCVQNTAVHCFPLVLFEGEIPFPSLSPMFAFPIPTSSIPPHQASSPASTPPGKLLVGCPSGEGAAVCSSFAVADARIDASDAMRAL